MEKAQYHVYAIFSKVDGRIYVGMSTDVERRVTEHNSGKVFSTKPFVPWKLFYSEFAGSSSIARDREKFYKSASGKRKLRKIYQTLNPGSLPD